MRIRASKPSVLPSVLLAGTCVVGLSAWPQSRPAQEGGLTVSVGPAGADVVGTDNVAIQKAIDRVAAAGGGTVLVKGGTYDLHDSVRLASHIRLRGEGAEKTILKKDAGVRSKLKLDADYGELQVTVEDAGGFRPGMGVAVSDREQRSCWTPSVRTIQRIDGQVLYLDHFLQMDYSVVSQGEVFNTFPLISGHEVEDVQVEDLTADGNRSSSERLNGCQGGAIYFFHSRKMTIRNCVARNYPGDGISTQFVEDPVIENSESFGNAEQGIHLGTGALRGIVAHNRVHDNGQDGLYLCWRVQRARYEENQSWNNGRDGISLGHKDTDNLFEKNNVSGNNRAGVFFRDETEINAAHRNTFRENTIEDNGRPGEPGYGVRIEGATKHLTFSENLIGNTRRGANATQFVGIFIGSGADYIIGERNTFEGGLRQAVVDQSLGGHNLLEQSSGR